MFNKKRYNHGAYNFGGERRTLRFPSRIDVGLSKQRSIPAQLEVGIEREKLHETLTDIGISRAINGLLPISLGISKRIWSQIQLQLGIARSTFYGTLIEVGIRSSLNVLLPVNIGLIQQKSVKVYLNLGIERLASHGTSINVGIQQTARGPLAVDVGVLGKHLVAPIETHVGTSKQPRFAVFFNVGLQRTITCPLPIDVYIPTDAGVLILDRNRQVRAVLPGVRWQYNRRINSATEINVYIPRTVVDDHIPAGHDLHGFFNTSNKLRYAEIAAYVQIYKGGFLKVAGKINSRTLGQVVTVQAYTEEILLEGNLTPAQYGKVWDGWDLADVARDLLDGWQTVRVKDVSQWQDRMVASSNIDLTTEPGTVMLAKRASGQYYDSGYITLVFNKSEIPNFKAWDRVRWSADSEDPVKTSIQVSTDGTSFSAPFDGGMPEEVGYYIGGDHNQVWVRINLSTSDTESEDENGNKVGVTPTVFALEVIARTEGKLAVGSVPSVAGVTVKGLSADHATAFNVLEQACEQVGWEFNVWDGALNLTEALGVDRTKDFVLRAGTNIEIQTLGDSDGDLVNILTAYRPGRGINRMEITLRDDASIAQFGEYPLAMEFEAESLAELQQKAQDFLDENNSPKTQFEIAAVFDYEREPEYGLGDKVRVADPETGIVTTTRIMAETREYNEQGLSVRLELGKAGFTLAEAIGGEKRVAKPLDPLQPTGVYARGAIAGLVVGCAVPKIDWAYTECHLSTASGFIPSSSTLRSSGRQNRFDIMELTPGVRYYAKLVHVDSAGRRSEPSREVSAVAKEPVPDGSLNDNKFEDALLPPETPTNFRGFPVYKQHVLTWDGAIRAHSFLLRYSTKPDGGSWGSWQQIPLPNSTIFTHSGLSLNLEYRYQLKAVGRSGLTSDWTDILELGKPGKVSLSEDLVDEHDWMSVWNRAEAITENGEFLADRIKGKLAEENMNFEPIEREIYAIEEALNSDDPDVWYSSIKQTADALVSEVARIEGALNDPNSEMWYSSIKQTANRIEQTVAKLDGSDPEQFSTIKQLADELSSIVADLSEGGETYTKIQQNANALSTLASSVTDLGEDISAVAQTANEISQTVSSLRDDVNRQSSTIQQLSNQIALRVVEVDGTTRVQTHAGITIGVVDSEGYIILDADKVIAPKTIKADMYEEIRNVLPYTGLDSLDENNPIEFDFYIPSETVNIVSIKLSAKGLPFRGYAKSAENAESFTTEVWTWAGGVTTSSAGDHEHSISTVNASTSSNGDHEHTYRALTDIKDAGSHSHSVNTSNASTSSSGSHTHSYTETTGTNSANPSHSHSLNYNDRAQTSAAGPWGDEHYHTYSMATGTQSANLSHSHTVSTRSSNTTRDGSHYHTYSAPSGTNTTGSHSHSFTTSNTYTSENGEHSHSYSAPTGTSYTGAHTHKVDLTDHSHTIPAHGHNLEFGIYEDTTPSGVNLYCDNGSGYGSAISLSSAPSDSKTPYELCEEKDLTGYFSGTGWKRIKFTSKRRGRINWQLIVKVDITA